MLAALLLVAQEPLPQVDCGMAETQAAMNRCAFQAYERADTDLNDVWSDVRRTMQDRDRRSDYDDGEPGSWPSLLAAQRAWIAYRDAHCRLASYDARGGSLQPLLRSTCMTRLTEARTAQLRSLLTNQVSGEPKTGNR